jgi:hypothetical protein
LVQPKDSDGCLFFDVVVCGGEPCGIAAAVAAARSGARTLLVEPTPHIGGLNTSGLNTAETEHMLAWTIGGIAAEVYGRLGKFYGTGQPEFFFESGVIERIFLEMLREAGVEILFSHRIARVERDGTAIRRLELAGPDVSVVEGKVYIDAGYEGDLMAMAGVEHALGRESSEEFGEEAAGIRFDAEPRSACSLDRKGRLLPGISGWCRDFVEGEGDGKVMCYNLRPTLTRDAEWRVAIPHPVRYNPASYQLLANWFLSGGKDAELSWILDLYERRNSKLEANNRQESIVSLGYLGGQFGWPTAGPHERARIFAEHLDYTLGFFYFLAHDAVVPARIRGEVDDLGLHAGEFLDNDFLPPRLYVREARRMRGVAVVTQHDVTSRREKTDSIAVGSHFIDCHHVQRLAVSDSQFINEGRIWRPGCAYQIPYGALTPKPSQCTNLLVPGAASFSHVAFSTYRLESVWMLGGHAAGVAAALACSASTEVQNVPVPQLQSLLRSQGQIVDFLPGCPERHVDGDGGWAPA